jgi:hypothetical protein
MREVHASVGFCRLNSRISELRSRGYVIECRRDGDAYLYTLLSSPQPGLSAGSSSLGGPGCVGDGEQLRLLV